MPTVDYTESLTAWECYGNCLRVACPTCKVRPYQECRRPDGKRKELTLRNKVAHYSRVEAYEQCRAEGSVR